ncbi:peptide chain release factor 2 [Dialister invisus]|uniref:peptide chain release factor 2 n=1 Tax=Dialister invisus TaxID=218538 RepID=UPI0036F1BAD2
MLEDLKKTLTELLKHEKEIRDSLDLPQLEEKIRSYDVEMSDPSFWENGDHAKEISQKATEAKAAYDTYTRLFARAESIKELLDMAIEENDQDMESELEEEIHELKDILDKKEIELLLNDEYDANNAIITFHAGAGGTEAQDWTEMLIRMYIKWAESEGFVLEELNMLPGDEAGVKSAEYMVRGKFAYGLLKSEKGVHRLVRISPFDAAKRRHTSFSAVDVMPEIGDDIEINLNMADVRVDYYRASGAGGQHINKTSSAVRMTHIPTGIVAACQNERSQFQNKEQCLRLLKAKLFELEMQKREQVKKGIEGEQQAIEWGSQIRSYVFQPYTLVKDNRTGIETGNIQSVMDGGLNPFIEGFLKHKKFNNA